MGYTCAMLLQERVLSCVTSQYIFYSEENRDQEKVRDLLLYRESVAEQVPPAVVRGS